jgi:hypothetical protein
LRSQPRDIIAVHVARHGTPKSHSARLRRRNTIVYAFTDDFALKLGYRAENIELKPCG